MPRPLNHETLSITFSVVEGLAVILTVFRVGFRLRIQRFWWEDLWAGVASIFTVISIVSVLVTHRSSDKQLAFVASRINEYMLTSIVWSVRMSIIFSIIRIASAPLLRRITSMVAASFALFWAATFGLQSWSCFCDTIPFSHVIGPNCVVPTFFPIFEVATNVVADLVTVILSLKLLWKVKLPRRQSRMILYLFTASRFLCAFSLAHAIAQIVSAHRVQEILAYLQVTIFMIVCNLVVVVTYVYRVFWNSSDEDNSSGTSYRSDDDDDFTAPSCRWMQSLTTVNLDSACPSFAENASEVGSTCVHSTEGDTTVS